MSNVQPEMHCSCAAKVVTDKSYRTNKRPSLVVVEITKKTSCYHKLGDIVVKTIQAS
jgi:hypothetical protein